MEEPVKLGFCIARHRNVRISGREDGDTNTAAAAACNHKSHRI